MFFEIRSSVAYCSRQIRIMSRLKGYIFKFFKNLIKNQQSHEFLSEPMYQQKKKQKQFFVHTPLFWGCISNCKDAINQCSTRPTTCALCRSKSYSSFFVFFAVVVVVVAQCNLTQIYIFTYTVQNNNKYIY